MAETNNEYLRVNHERLLDYVTEVFSRLGVPRDDAIVTADVLVQADLRGVESHGVQRLGRYVGRLKKGLIEAMPTITVVNETSAAALVDGGNGLGQPIGKFAMELCLLKAEQAGGAFVAVRNSNHYGIAGYYAMMALSHQMIGFSYTNSRPLVVPTNGRERILGTNPIGMAVPTGTELPFVLDMATSVAPIGKVEVAQRKGTPIPLGWAVDKNGLPTTNSNILATGGGLMPLGGPAESAGYKGYGLAVMVDILCGVLSGATFGRFVDALKDGQEQPANVGHFFAAINIDAFRPLVDFQSTMDMMIGELKNSAKAEGADRIFIHGEKEFEKEQEYRRDGVPLYHKVVEEIRGMGADLGIAWNLT